MKIKKIFLASLILLAIIAIGTVSAADNITAGDDAIAENTDTPVLSEDEYVTVTVSADTTLKYNENVDVEVNVSEGTYGYVDCYFDKADEEDDYYPYIDYEQPYWGSTHISEFGTHTLYVKYFNGNMADKVFEFPFTITDYEMDVYPEDMDETYYGKN